MSNSNASTLDDLVYLRRERVSKGDKDPAKRYVGLEHIAQGTPKLLGTAPSSSSKSTNSVFHPGDILFGKLRPYLEKSVQVNFTSYCSTDILVLVPRDGVHPAYAAKVLQQKEVFKAAVSTSVGTRMPRTSWEHLKNYEIHLPSLPEQRRIADVLDTVDAAIRETDDVIAKQEQVKTGLLQDLLTRGLDTDGRLRDPEANPGAFQETELGRLPRNWSIHRFDEVIAEGPQNGLYKPKSAYTEDERGYPIVRIDSFYAGKLTAGDSLRRLKLTPKELNTYGLAPRDILINRVNSRGFIGKNAIVPDLSEPTVFESNIMRLKVDRDTILPEFLNGLMNTPIVLRQLQVRAKDAVAQSSINQQDVNECLIPTPDLEEQRKAIRRIEAQEGQIEDTRAYQSKLRRMKTGLMQDLLTGRVRVPEAEKRVQEITG